MSTTGKRRKSRELAMQMLFQADVGKQTPDQVGKTFWGSRDDVDAETRGFSEDIFRVATARNEEIDELIQAHSANWRLSRMPAVDRNVLRAAIAELLGFPEDRHWAFLISLGYPADRPLVPVRHPNRRPFSEVVHRGRW